MRACGATHVTDTTLKDVLPLTADLTTAELAEALGALRFHGKSRCLGPSTRTSATTFCAPSGRDNASPLPATLVSSRGIGRLLCRDISRTVPLNPSAIPVAIDSAGL